MENIRRSYVKFGPLVQEEMLFKDIFIWSSGGLFVMSGTICAILVEGFKRNNSVKLF